MGGAGHEGQGAPALQAQNALITPLLPPSASMDDPELLHYGRA